MATLDYKNESYAIIGKLKVEVARERIPFSREEQFIVNYDGVTLNHYFYADFTVLDKIILEVKGVEALNDSFILQCRNYLKVSGYRLALLVNFGTSELQFKRIVL